MAKVAHIANMYGPKSGGLKTTMNELAREYVESGHCVLLITPSEKDEIIQEGKLIRQSIKGPKIPFSGGYRIILRVGQVIKALKKFQPDVIEISDRTTLLKVSDWAAKEEIPTSFFAHERLDGVLKSFLPWLPFQKGITKYWNKKTAARVDRVVVTTNFAAAEFLDIGMEIINLPTSPLVHIPLGVDLELYHPDAEFDTHQFIKQLPPKFLFACTRLSKEKDPEFLLEIAREIKSIDPHLPLLIAGSGPMEKYLKQKADNESLNIEFLGFISNKRVLAHILARASAFLAVGPIETFGLAALEALASGTPVVCRKEAAISEIINFESGSALIRDANSWAEQLLKYSGDKSGKFSESARARAEEFSWQRSADSLLNLYPISAVA